MSSSKAERNKMITYFTADAGPTCSPLHRSGYSLTANNLNRDARLQEVQASGCKENYNGDAFLPTRIYPAPCHAKSIRKVNK